MNYMSSIIFKINKTIVPIFLRKTILPLIAISYGYLNDNFPCR
jgi:hypothetical protein